MARKGKSNAAAGRNRLGRLFWLLGAGLAVLLVLALATHDPADWPGEALAPRNEAPANWIGPVGAYVSHRLFRMFGLGLWVPVAGGLGALLWVAAGRAITHPVVRGAGLVLAGGAVSLLLRLLVPGAGYGPEGDAGLVAFWAGEHLVARFSFVGSLVVAGVGLLLGLILAMDELLTGAARRLGRLAGRLAGVSLSLPELRLPALRLPGRRRAAGREASVEEEGAEEPGPAAPEPVDEDAQAEEPAPAAPPPPPRARAPRAGAGSGGGGEEEEDDGEAGAPATYLAEKTMDPEAVKRKIAELPINFAPRAKAPAAAPEVDLSGYRFPGLDLLDDPEDDFSEQQEGLVREQAAHLEQAMQQYRIEGEVVAIDTGPTITLYEVRLAPGTKVNSLSAVSSDLARAMKAHNIRIVPSMAGRDTVGIEVPNQKREKVRLKELMGADPEIPRKMKLPMWLGKDASGQPLTSDLAAMPHMLIAGTTGSGKSVCMNTIIMSFLFTRRPDELKLVLVDPKMVEMSMYKDVPHLMCPVVTEMAKAAAILEWAVGKMDERYELLAEAGVRDIAGYNALEWEELKERFEPADEAEEARIPKKLPWIVFVIDELADLMMTNGKEVENHIVRIAQKARAVGMHLILATQRPQANVVTGLIKSNMPCRVAFKVASGMDSRIVLDQKGGELLLGHGDMMFLHPGTSKISRAQGTLVDDVEIRRTVKFLKKIAEPSFEPQLVQIGTGSGGGAPEERDELFDEAVRTVLESRRGSASLLQRRFSIGYSRASRLIEQMADAGILGAFKGSQAREVNVTLEEYEQMLEEVRAEESGGGEAGIPDEEDEGGGVPDELEGEYRG